MMVTMATPLLLALLVGALPSRAFGEGACLQDGKHKTTPSAEPQLTECSLYTDNACCTVEDVQDIAHVPALSNKNAPWDHCGHLSSTCEVFLKRVSCFYRCSPDAARWPHPRRRSYIQAVPLCHSFCRDWFDACRMDLTCARNWARDPRGHNCTGTCVQYQQMYQHGRDLCESLWGDAFMTVEDQVEEEEGGHHDGVHGNDGPPGDGHPGDSSRPCGCLTLSSSDRDVMAALRAQSVDPEELDTTKSGLPQYRAPCQAPPPPAPGSTLSTATQDPASSEGAGTPHSHSHSSPTPPLLPAQLHRPHLHTLSVRRKPSAKRKVEVMEVDDFFDGIKRLYNEESEPPAGGRGGTGGGEEEDRGRGLCSVLAPRQEGSVSPCPPLQPIPAP